MTNRIIHHAHHSFSVFPSEINISKIPTTRGITLTNLGPSATWINCLSGRFGDRSQDLLRLKTRLAWDGYREQLHLLFDFRRGMLPSFLYGLEKACAAWPVQDGRARTEWNLRRHCSLPWFMEKPGVVQAPHADFLFFLQGIGVLQDDTRRCYQIDALDHERESFSTSLKADSTRTDFCRRKEGSTEVKTRKKKSKSYCLFKAVVYRGHILSP